RLRVVDEIDHGVERDRPVTQQRDAIATRDVGRRNAPETERKRRTRRQRRGVAVISWERELTNGIQHARDNYTLRAGRGRQGAAVLLNSCSTSTSPGNAHSWRAWPTTRALGSQSLTHLPKRARAFASAHGHQRSTFFSTCWSAGRWTN